MSRKTFSRIITLSESSGKEVDINLFLNQKPMREQQKLKTLIKYIEEHPSGWKKRLELADLFYEMGKWQQAVDEYQQVIQRQPELISVQLKLGKILQLMDRKKEAIEIYQDSLSLVSNLKFSCPTLADINSNLATQYHINGLIEICRNNFLLAVDAFSLATKLEPDKPSHWLALGQVQQLRGNNIDAISAFNTILFHSPEDIIALINIYDSLMNLGKTYRLSSLNTKKTDQKKNITLTNNKWYRQAKTVLDQILTLAPDNYQALKRQIEYRCQMKLVSGMEGKKTKQLLNHFLKLLPNSGVGYQLQAYYYKMQQQSSKL